MTEIEEFKNFKASSVDYYQVAYKCNTAFPFN